MAINSSNDLSNKIIIRLLNGPLLGCEFVLSPGRTLFIVGDSSSLMMNDYLPNLPRDTLFIPLEQGGSNFEVVFEDTEPQNAVLRKLSADGSDEDARSPIFNQVLHIGKLAFALRLENQFWSSEVLDYPNVIFSPKKTKKNSGYISTILALMIVTSLLVGGFWLWTTPQQQANELGVLLGNEDQRFHVLFGRNKIFYIIANNERDVSWAQQVIARGESKEPVKVISSARENERVTRWLADNYPAIAYYRLQMDDPLQPELWVSRQRSIMSNDILEMLRKRLMTLLPYAEHVNIVSMDDSAAVHQAEVELKRNALPYSRSDQNEGISFVIQGALNDGELLRAQKLVDDYYRQWGERYVHFSIELKDDWLKSYSFQYGDQGYVKISPENWYFPKPL